MGNLTNNSYLRSLLIVALAIVTNPLNCTPLPHEKREENMLSSLKNKPITIYFDIPYSSDHARNTLDIYVPPKNGSFPVLLFVHGGKWSKGDKKLYAHIGRHFAINDICVVVMNYRLSPEVKHPEHVIDIAKAFSWVYNNIGEFGGKKDSIYLMGHSSGAHVISLMALHDCYLAKYNLTSDLIKGVICVSGVYSINRNVNFVGAGHVFNEVDKPAASPITYCKTGMKSPPFLLLYAAKDFLTLESQALRFQKALVSCGIKCDCIEAEDESHESIIINSVDDLPHNNKILEFIKAKHSEQN